jgi:hypothetical protein
VRKTIAAAAALLALAAPAAASADYTISRAEAQSDARDAARTLYADYGVTYNGTSASCHPQFTRYDRRYTYHRWVCGWATKVDGDYVAGLLRITGHTGQGNYGYLVLRGIHYV